MLAGAGFALISQLLVPFTSQFALSLPAQVRLVAPAGGAGNEAVGVAPAWAEFGPSPFAVTADTS